MSSDEGPLQLDANVVYPEKSPAHKKKGKRSGTVFIAVIGLILISALLIYQPENSEFIDSPPPEEQAERDSVTSVAARIVSFEEQNDSLPMAEEIDLPPGYVYRKEDDLLWSLETPGGLFYTSDMEIDLFQEGVL